MTTDDDRVSYLARDEEGPSEALGADERAALDDLRALLGDDSMWVSPPAALEDAVVSAVAEAAERGRLTAVPTSPGRSGRRGTPPGRRWLRPVLAAAAALLLAVAGGALLRQWTADDDEPALAVALESSALGAGAQGTAAFTRTDSGWRIELDATGLPRRADGAFYEAWLKDADGVLVSVGTFNEGRDVVLWAGVPPTTFTTMTVTQEVADGDPTSSGRVVLSGQLTD